MKSTVSLFDVAKAAGVSHTSVSLVLNNRHLGGRVSAAKVNRIRQLASQLGYVPQQAARSLKLGRTGMIVVATREALHHSQETELIEAIQVALVPQHYQVVLELLQFAPEREAHLCGHTRAMADGLIMLGADPMLEAVTRNWQPGVPLVLVGATDTRAFFTATYDRAHAVNLGVTHLVAQGHRHVALVFDAKDGLLSRQRVAGYRTALAAAAIPWEPNRLIRTRSDANPRELAAQILGLNPRPTGLFCYNDELGLRLLQVLHRLGVRVPEELALVVQGNTRLTTLDEVPLTAVDTNKRGIARAVVEMLLEQIRNPQAPPRQVLVQPFLVERESSRKREP